MLVHQNTRELALQLFLAVQISEMLPKQKSWAETMQSWILADVDSRAGICARLVNSQSREQAVLRVAEENQYIWVHLKACPKLRSFCGIKRASNKTLWLLFTGVFFILLELWMGRLDLIFCSQRWMGRLHLSFRGC